MEARIHALAAQILSADHMRSFVALDLKAKLVGVATLAHIGGETEVRDACLKALQSIA